MRLLHVPRVICILGLVMLAGISRVALAQEASVSDNQVNAVARKLYCPVCENIPLDECQTVTCVEWKEEIRAQLEAGGDAQSVIDSFVRRFGDSVVGIPQDPVLRTLTLLAPIVAVAVFAAVGVVTFRRFSRHNKPLVHDSPTPDALTDAEYRERLEADLKARR